MPAGKKLPPPNRKNSQLPLRARILQILNPPVPAHTLSSADERKNPAKSPITALASPAFTLPGTPVIQAKIVATPPRPRKPRRKMEAARVTPECLQQEVACIHMCEHMQCMIAQMKDPDLVEDLLKFSKHYKRCEARSLFLETKSSNLKNALRQKQIDDDLISERLREEGELRRRAERKLDAALAECKELRDSLILAEEEALRLQEELDTTKRALKKAETKLTRTSSAADVLRTTLGDEIRSRLRAEEKIAEMKAANVNLSALRRDALGRVDRLEEDLTVMATKLKRKQYQVYNKNKTMSKLRKKMKEKRKDDPLSKPHRQLKETVEPRAMRARKAKAEKAIAKAIDVMSVNWGIRIPGLSSSLIEGCCQRKRQRRRGFHGSRLF